MLRILRRYARELSVGNVVLTESPAEAEAILFVETVDWRDPLFTRVLAHPLMKRYRHKVVLYNEAEDSRARLPSIAMNAANVPWQIAMGSLPIHEDQAPIAPMSDAPGELMSFVGSRNNQLRHQLLDTYAQTQPAVIDTDAYDAWHTTRSERSEQRRTFEQALSAGLFALCPRGGGTTSLRLYEAMQAGRCPVILSDEWVEDHGVDWSFAVRVAEVDIDRLEPILSAIPRSEALQRGAEARRQWEVAYSPARYLDTLADAARALLDRQVTVPARNPLQLLGDARYRAFLAARQAKAHVGLLGSAVSSRLIAADGDRSS